MVGDLLLNWGMVVVGMVREVCIVGEKSLESVCEKR